MPLLSLVLSAATVPVAATSAISSTAAMYDFWCTPARAEVHICKQRALSLRLKAATDEASKKALASQIMELSKAARAVTPSALPGGRSLIMQQYSEMKMGYCASNPPDAKTLCSTAASRYGSSSSATFSSSAMAWYCAKPVHEESICKRAELVKTMRDSSAAVEKRRAVATELKQFPSPPFATTQAIYADYCKVALAKSPSDQHPSCLNLKRTQQQQQMVMWYCVQPTNADSPWCKREAILAKMRALASTPENVEQRKTLTQQLVAIAKSGLKIADAIMTARKAYCAHLPAVADAKPLCPVPATP